MASLSVPMRKCDIFTSVTFHYLSHTTQVLLWLNVSVCDSIFKMNLPPNVPLCNAADLTKFYERNLTRTGVNHLPSDVFCDIFLRSLPSLDEMWDCGLDLNQASITAPFYISHVFQDWCRVSLSFGELWSSLCITSRWCDSWKLMVDIFETWLRRTNECPLNFTVNLHGFHVRENAQSLAEHMIINLTFSRLS